MFALFNESLLIYCHFGVVFVSASNVEPYAAQLQSMCFYAIGTYPFAHLEANPIYIGLTFITFHKI